MRDKELLDDEQALKVGLRCAQYLFVWHPVWHPMEINAIIYLLYSIHSKNSYILKSLTEEKYKHLRQFCDLIRYTLKGKTQQIKRQPSDSELGLIIYLAAANGNTINSQIVSLINSENLAVALKCACVMEKISVIDKLICSNFVSVDQIQLNCVLQELIEITDYSISKQTIDYILQKSEELKKDILALHAGNVDDYGFLNASDGWNGHVRCWINKVDIANAAVTSRNVEIIEHIIEKGFNVNAALYGFIKDIVDANCCPDGLKPDLLTLNNNESKIFSLLIEKGASLKELFNERWHKTEGPYALFITEDEALIFFNIVINQQMLKLIIVTNSFIIEPKEEQTKLNEFKIKRLKIFIEEIMADLTLEKKVKCLYRSIQISENLGTSMIFNKLRSEPDICISGDIKKKITGIITGTGTETDKEKLKYDSELYHGLVLPLRREIQHERKSTSQLPPRLKLDDTQGHSKSDKQEPPKQRPMMV